jgi:hypothetical protein
VAAGKKNLLAREGTATGIAGCRQKCGIHFDILIN